jgi:chromosome segregation ATPase
LLPDGLVCTENDLAFLQCMETVQQQRQLQRELSGLDKAVKTAAQEKEQLSHQAQKIQADVRQMKEKYVTTLSSVHSLQLTSDDPNSAHLTGVTPEEPTTAELSHAHLARLRQTRKLMAVQLEKTEREIQRKTYAISQEREAVEDKRVKESLNVDELRKDLENIQLEKREWEERVRKASATKQAMEKELESLQSQLKASQTVPTDLSPPHTQSASSERREADERLRRLVKRCELYVRRHELLKQLRQQI